MYKAWMTYLFDKKNALNTIFTLIVLIVVLIILPPFLQFIEERPGFSFKDPLLILFNPLDVTWLTFGLIYAGLIFAIFNLSKKPQLLLLALKTYTLTVMFRMTAMYFLPLAPPGTMIVLHDPFIQFFASGEILTKDLFFSGHTSTMFILFLCVKSIKMKYTFLMGTLLVAACVLIQHVHYTVDVIAAPFFAYASFKLAQSLEKYFYK